MQTLTVAVRSSDGAIFHQETNGEKTLRRLAGGDTIQKWRHVVRQLLKHRRACRVWLIVGFHPPCKANGYNTVWKYDELTYRPVDPVDSQPTTDAPLAPERLP